MWSESRTGVTIPSDGILYLDLGSVTPLDANVFSGGKKYLEVTIDAQITTPRIVIESAPYAIRSGEASHTADSAQLGTHPASFFQARVSNACSSGSAIASIDAAGCGDVPARPGLHRGHRPAADRLDVLRRRHRLPGARRRRVRERRDRVDLRRHGAITVPHGGHRASQFSTGTVHRRLLARRSTRSRRAPRARCCRARTVPARRPATRRAPGSSSTRLTRRGTSTRSTVQKRVTGHVQRSARRSRAINHGRLRDCAAVRRRARRRRRPAPR